MYQLARFSFGKARSLAPIMSGTRKLPSVDGIDGIRKKNTMITPCIVNSLLYVSSDTRSPGGVTSSSRMSTANDPPRKKKNVMAARYRSAIRL